MHRKYSRLEIMNHSRTLLIVFFVLLFTLSGMNNTSKAQAVQYGIKGGINISSHFKQFWFIEDDIRLELDPKVTTGYQAGLIIKKNFSRVVRLQTEPTFIMLGAHYNENFTLRGFELETESRTKLLYLQLPLLLQFSTAPSQNQVYGRERSMTTFHLSTGVFGGYLLDAQFTGTNSGAPLGISFQGDFSNDVTPQYSEFDAGALLGLGFEYGRQSKIGFETRALLSVIDSGKESDMSFFRPKNIGVTFSVYFLF